MHNLVAITGLGVLSPVGLDVPSVAASLREARSGIRTIRTAPLEREFAAGANDLESAQAAKYRALAGDLGIEAGDHVLEIGCGWGGFAEFAARDLGCRVTGLTISREQRDFAARRVQEAGLADRVEIMLRDYRDESGTYDKIASIEMLEAVGEKYWPVFFGKMRACLKAGGSAGLQIITINDPVAKVHYSLDLTRKVAIQSPVMFTKKIEGPVRAFPATASAPRPRAMTSATPDSRTIWISWTSLCSSFGFALPALRRPAAKARLRE